MSEKFFYMTNPTGEKVNLRPRFNRVADLNTIAPLPQDSKLNIKY